MRPVAGACPIPMQPLQPDWWIRPPAWMSRFSRPISERFSRIWREVGTEVKRFLRTQDRDGDWVEILPDEDANYDEYEEINLSELEPLIALPSSPGKVVPVHEVAGKEVYQTMIGSSACGGR